MLFSPPGLMSRQKMEEVINGGGSVMVGDTIVSEVRDLPSEVELADLKQLRMGSKGGWWVQYERKLQELAGEIRAHQERRGP